MPTGFRILFGIACLLLVAEVALAQKVLLAQPPATDPTLFEAFGRLRAELELQAFDVIVIEQQGTTIAAEQLEHEAQQHHAFAAIALQRGDGATTAEVCIVDRVTGKTTLRRLRIDSSAHGPTLLAVRAADLLRASLMEFTDGKPPAKDVLGVEETPPPPELVRFSRAESRFDVRTGGVVLLNPSLGSGLGLLLGVGYRPTDRLSAAVELAGPLFGAQFDAEGGVAKVRQEFALLTAGWNLAAATSGRRLEWSPVVGVGAYHLEATGAVEPPYIAETDRSWSVVASAGLRAQYFFSPSLSTAFDARVLALLPRPVIAVADQRSQAIAVQAHTAISFGIAF